ncbi:flavin reductase family protein [Acetonema longum]|uniref:Putative flavoredoxin n=1 Tax=Acetonema longum DSM 6540 TaxID=1009370 RepID=F7NG19_9FIRM|nr:flavin reductase family protein [Acetonema longum]EGO64937.1 putative flavoredoxin [Acetonema longum DSM 6540]
MKQVAYHEYASQALPILSKGAFLTTAHGDKRNTMTIGWGNIGFIWGKPVFTAMIRHSRFTHELIETSGEFTVSFPFGDQGKALSLCGTKSGRDLDKFAAANLQTVPGQKIATPVINLAGLHYECQTVYRQDMSPSDLVPAFQSKWYGDTDYHTLYYGEIVACYVTE